MAVSPRPVLVQMRGRNPYDRKQTGFQMGARARGDAGSGPMGEQKDGICTPMPRLEPFA